MAIGEAIRLFVAKFLRTRHFRSVRRQQILGIQFCDGDVEEVLEGMFRKGGFLIAPSGTCFARLSRDATYREAVISADVAIPDSGAMVLLWRIVHRQKIPRISGLRYLQQLSTRLFAEKAKVLWVLPNESARRKTGEWLQKNQFPFRDEDFYFAPMYGAAVEDRALVAKIDNQRPDHVIVGIGSGPQEKLGYYLRENLSYRPAIHCVGAALGFLTGDQVAIPDWADRFYLGWLLRLFAQPRVFIPRLSRALQLPWFIARYGAEPPPLRAQRTEDSREK
jgi:exopolysaccharide biosynthesis WecB/TagA/CpsF family protein